MRLQRTSLLSLLVALLLVAAACGSDGDSSSDAGSSAEPGAEAPASEEQATDDGADVVAAEGDAAGADEAKAEGEIGAGGLSDNAALQPIDTGRDIIFTAFVEVEVEDVTASSQQAMTAIQGLGGLLFGQNTSTEGVVRSTLTFKVAPKDFQTALARLGEIGFLRNQQITADDVTERVVDLESQIITAEASVIRLRAVLENVTTVAEIAELERQLLERETTLELLRGQLRTIENQVGLATITITLTQKVPGPELEIDQTAYLAHDGGTTCPGFEELSGDEGEAITLCYVVTNTGDTLLGEIDVRDDGFNLELEDMIVVDGSLDEPLAIGASVTLAAAVTAEPFTNGRAQATAISVAADGTDLRFGQTAGRDDLQLDIAEDLSLPGFLDGFGVGASVVVLLIDVLVVSAGFILPLIWIFPLVWFLRRLWLRRRAAKAAKVEEQLRASAHRMPPPAPADERTAVTTPAAATPPPPPPATDSKPPTE